MKLYKKEKKNWNKLIYLFHRNLRFQKFIKTSPSVLLGGETRTKLICTPTNLDLSLTTTQWLGKHYTLANSNLHQTLVSFLYMIPSCKQY